MTRPPLGEYWTRRTTEALMPSLSPAHGLSAKSAQFLHTQHGRPPEGHPKLQPGGSDSLRKLYQVRHHGNGGLLSGRQVGHKARLLPRAAAFRVAKRLRQAGLYVTCDPICVRVTHSQAMELHRRYAPRVAFRQSRA